MKVNSLMNDTKFLGDELGTAIRVYLGAALPVGDRHNLCERAGTGSILKGNCNGRSILESMLRTRNFGLPHSETIQRGSDLLVGSKVPFIPRSAEVGN